MLLMFPFMLAAQSGTALQKELGDLLNDKLFDTGDVSLMVYDLTADSLLFSHRAHKLVRPASVQKTLTSIVALEHLGIKEVYNP